MNPSLEQLSALEIGERVRSGDLSAVDVWDHFHGRMTGIEPKTGAFLEIYDHQRSRAERLDRDVTDGVDPGPFAGVPVALKDNIAFAGHPLTCASRILEGYVSPFSATAVQRLLDAGAVIFGRTNMDELGMGSSSERSAFQTTRNPWNLERVPGGSSGGSAAAVACGLPLALGTDTGGSIRQPASFCGIVGLKPSYGRVSRFGLVAFASSTDQIGPLTPDVPSAAAALGTMAGLDPRDATSDPAEVQNYLSAVEGIAAEPGAASLKGVRVGIMDQVDTSALTGGAAEDWQRSLDTLRRLGAEIRNVSVANLGAAIACYYVITNAEASANFARLDGMRYGRRSGDAHLDQAYVASRSEGLGPEVKRRILLGTFALSSGYYEAYYGRAQAVRRALSRQFSRAFEQVDVIVTPTSPTGAFALGEKLDDPLAMYLADVFTTAPSLAGLPALSVPSGLDGDGLPLGLQILGRPMDESTVLKVGHAFEVATPLPPVPEMDGH